MPDESCRVGTRVAHPRSPSIDLHLLSLNRPRESRRCVLSSRGNGAANVSLSVHKVIETVLDVVPESRNVGVIPARFVHPRRQAANHAEACLHKLR